MEALARTRIPGEARQVLDFILRKTYGWHKKEDSISLSQFSDGTGLHRSKVCRCLNKLIEMRIIYKGSPQFVTPSPQSVTTSIQVYGFQKDFEKWGVVPKKSPSPQSVTKGSDNMVNRVVPKVSHTKETIQKKTNKRKIALPDEDFWKEIKAIYTWVDIDVEIQKMKGYQLTPKGRSWKMTRARVIYWLNKIDKPLLSNVTSTMCFLNERGFWECRQCGKTFTLRENMEKHKHEPIRDAPDGKGLHKAHHAEDVP